MVERRKGVEGDASPLRTWISAENYKEGFRTSGRRPERKTGEILWRPFLHRPSYTLLSVMLRFSGPELTSLARAVARRELRTQKCSLPGDAGRHGGDLKTSRRSFPVWHI